MFKIFFKIASLFFFISISACVTYTDETLKMRDQFEDKHYESALKSLDSSDLKKSKKNRFLYRAERAMILDRSGKLKESRKNLFAADKVADELFTVSISKTAATFVYNESASDYAGEDYEKVGLHSILALSFLEENNYKSALVEARKINNKLYEITSQRKNSSTYKNDAFARFLSGLIREASGDYDGAIIDYRKAKSIMENLPYKNFYVGSLSTDLIRSLYGVLKRRGRNNLLKALKKEYPKITSKYEKKLKKTPGGGDLVVIHEVGKIARKRAKDFILPIEDHVVRFSFPYIFQRNINHHNSINGLLVDGTYFSGSNIANLNAIAYQSLEDKRLRLIAKGAARLLLKAQITNEAEKNFGAIGWLAGNLYSTFTETADTRSWTLMPQAFYITRVRLPKGENKISIKTAGRVVASKTLRIKSGDLKILRSKY